MNEYAVNVLAYEQKNGKINIKSDLFIIRAKTEQDARIKGFELGDKVYPGLFLKVSVVKTGYVEKTT